MAQHGNYNVYQKTPWGGWMFKDSIEASSQAEAVRALKANQRRRGNVAPSGTKTKAEYAPVNNPSLRAQVRRLPTGEIQLKIPLTRNPASLKQAMKAVRKLGRRVKSMVVTGMKRAKRNPFEPGLSLTWYRKGQSAGRNKKWKDMYDAWHWVKAKPTIPGKRVTAQESFFQGWFDATQRP